MKIEIEKQELETLIKVNEDFKQEIEILKESVIKIMDVMGLIDKETGKMREEIASGEESFVPSMLKSLGDIITLLTKSQMPKFFGGEKAKDELLEKFSFIKKMLPIINKHAK
ncbi:MAG: hypothetical protein JST67_08485 [Bacteroidetes bacterium]|nr:hypothetical protein [Bacteroidota bacterium]